MKFVRKMDEMELHLSLNAIRVAWFFTVMVLFVWGIWEHAQTGRFTFGLLVIITNKNASPGTESESTVKHFLRPVVRFAFRRNAVFFSVWSRFLTVCGGDCKSGPVRPQRSLYTDETGLSRFRTWLCRPYRN